MSALWSVEVVAKDGARITLRVAPIHPDAGRYSDGAVFALRLLYDEAYGYGPGLVREVRGPLGEAIALEQTFDAGVMAGAVDRFVRAVAVEPGADAATYRIEVTDPRWLAHLAVGQRWESAAYDD